MRYFDRIGAVCEGAGKYYVSDGYERKWAIIKEDGTLHVDESLPPPSKDEAKEIKANAEKLRELVLPIYPVPVSAGLPNVEGKLFVYRDAENRVLLAVQRVDLEGYDKKGKPKKDYLPWLYNGAKWEQKAWPKEIPCPLYGNHHGRDKIMIHEGEKACQAAIDAAKPGSGHPWQEELALYGHCTWRGGKRGLWGAAWGELSKDAEVWILPDNDAEGYDSAFVLAGKLTHCKSVYLLHHRNFPGVPKSWDIADKPFTPHWGNVEAGFRICEKAYYMWYDAQADKEVPVLRKEFVQKFAYSISSGEFIEVDRPVSFMKPESLNNAYLHLCPPQWNSLSKKMLANPHMTIVDKIGYRPATFDENGVFHHAPYFTDDQGSHCANMYRPISSRPVKPQSWGEYRPLLAYVRHLLPKPQERKILLRWIACLVAGRRLPWAVLMISETQGTGKSTLSRMVRALVGTSNSSQVTPSTLQDKFTSWALNKQLIVVPELKEGSAFQLAEHLKTFIEDPTIPIRRMNVDQYDTENHLSILASSNHLTAISIKRGDRRWFVPTVTEELPPLRSSRTKMANHLRKFLTLPEHRNDGAFFVSIQDWFYNQGGLERVLWAARQYGKKLVETGWHAKNSRSPETEKRSEVEKVSEYPWEERLKEMIEDAEVVVAEDIRREFEDSNLKFVPKTAFIVEKLSELGWSKVFSDTSSSDDKTRRGYVIVASKTEDGKQKHVRGVVMASSHVMLSKNLGLNDGQVKPTMAMLRPLLTVYSPVFKAFLKEDAF